MYKVGDVMQLGSLGRSDWIYNAWKICLCLNDSKYIQYYCSVNRRWDRMYPSSGAHDERINYES